LIEAAIETIRPSAAVKDIRIVKLLDPFAGPISGDPARLQQVVWNLLSNAVKFTPKGEKIQVRLERVNSHIELSVSDTGQGIEPEFLPHLFERFRQADASTSRKHGGLGIGLAIVKEIVELHGGSVRAKGEGLDEWAISPDNAQGAPVDGDADRHSIVAFARAWLTRLSHSSFESLRITCERTSSRLRLPGRTSVTV
jgi:signal transduction histidine kinase